MCRYRTQRAMSRGTSTNTRRCQQDHHGDRLSNIVQCRCHATLCTCTLRDLRSPDRVHNLFSEFRPYTPADTKSWSRTRSARYKTHNLCRMNNYNYTDETLKPREELRMKMNSTRTIFRHAKIPSWSVSFTPGVAPEIARKPFTIVEPHQSIDSNRDWNCFLHGNTAGR